LKKIVDASLAEELGQVVVDISGGGGVRGGIGGGRGGVVGVRVLGVVHLVVRVVVGVVVALLGVVWSVVVVVVVCRGRIVVAAVVARLGAVALRVVVLVFPTVLLLLLLLLDPLGEGVAGLLLVRGAVSHLLLVQHSGHVEVQLSQSRMQVSSVHLGHLEHGLHQVRVELGGLRGLAGGPGGRVSVAHVGAPGVTLSRSIAVLRSTVLRWHVTLSVGVPGAVLERVGVLSSGPADGALVSEEDWAGHLAVRGFQGVGGVD